MRVLLLITLLFTLLCISGCATAPSKTISVRIVEGNFIPEQQEDKQFLRKLDKEYRYWIRAFERAGVVDLSLIKSCIVKYLEKIGEPNIDLFFDYLREENERFYREGETVFTQSTLTKIFRKVKHEYTIIKYDN